MAPAMSSCGLRTDSSAITRARIAATIRSLRSTGNSRRSKVATNVPFREARACSLFLLRNLQQRFEFGAPQSRDRVAAVTARFLAEWNRDGAAVRDTFCLPLENAELG